jgi:hypothetical protein
VLLLLKLVLVPAIIAGVTLAGRRWGHAIGGLLAGLPLVAGPVLFFLAVEQGAPFAARAAHATLVGIGAVAVFAVVYAWMSLRTSWPGSLGASWIAFGGATALLHAVPWTLTGALGVAVGCFLVGRWLLPRARPMPAPFVPPRWDLPLRMAVAVGFVLAVTGLAAWLGPRLSGALNPFPVATAILVGFAHAQEGSAVIGHWFRSFLPAMVSFALFCYVAAALLVPAGYPLAFTAALGVQLGVQALLLALMRRARGSARSGQAPHRPGNALPHRS